MESTVFYSWQSDLPNTTNRGFIGKALENAAKSIRDDDSILVEPVIDRDTAGVPGSPDIATTILKKIENAQVFVSDISIINGEESARPTPNPNVLIELGYAMKALGPDRIIMVLNTAYGKPEMLPFDLRMRRAISYSMPESQTDRAAERKQLEATLAQALRAIFNGLRPVGEAIQPLSLSQQAIASIEGAQPNQGLLTRRFMLWLTEELDALAPDYSQTTDKKLDDLLVEAIDRTAGLVVEFAHLAEAIAAMNAREAAIPLYKGFEAILKRYHLPRGFSGGFRGTDFDFFKFIGHELFVTFFSFLLRENRWELVADLLEESFYIENASGGNPELCFFHDISKYVDLLNQRNDRLQLRRISLHADILNARHTEGELSKVVSLPQFINADYFLFLRGQFEDRRTAGRMPWKPWSALYMRDQAPRFLVDAVRSKNAEQVLRPLGLKSIEEFRQRLGEEAPILQRLFNNSWDFDLLSNFNPQMIGSR